jgi:hypothetical protein
MKQTYLSPLKSFLLLLLFVVSGSVFAVNVPKFSIAAGGTWSTNGTWNSGACASGTGTVAPTASDDVTICGNSTVNITGVAACNNLTIGDGVNASTLTWTAGATLTVHGNLIITNKGVLAFPGTNGCNIIVLGSVTLNTGATGGKVTYNNNTSNPGFGNVNNATFTIGGNLI